MISALRGLHVITFNSFFAVCGRPQQQRKKFTLMKTHIIIGIDEGTGGGAPLEAEEEVNCLRQFLLGGRLILQF